MKSDRITGRFQYVLDKSKRASICFGSRVPRDVLPTCGPMTPYMQRMGATRGSALGPDLNIYDRRRIKSGVIGRSPRWIPDRIQSPRPSQEKPRTVKSAPAPFNQSSKRFDEKLNTNPGVGTYNPTAAKKKLEFYHSFGGKKTLAPAIRVRMIKCVPFNEDICAICGTDCSEQGDYWHRDDKSFLCRNCMEKIFRNPRRYKHFNYKDYKPIRDCFFAHHHEKFKNAVILMSDKNIKRKIYTETYLSNYFSNIVDKKYT